MFNTIDGEVPTKRNKGIAKFLRTKTKGEAFEVPPDSRNNVHAAANSIGMKVATRSNKESGMVDFYVLEPARVKDGKYNLTAVMRTLQLEDRVNVPSQYASAIHQAAKNAGIEVVTEADDDVPGTHLVERIA